MTPTPPRQSEREISKKRSKAQDALAAYIIALGGRAIVMDSGRFEKFFHDAEYNYRFSFGITGFVPKEPNDPT